MRVIEAEDGEDLWLKGLEIVKRGAAVSPRQLGTMEISPMTFVLHDVSKGLITNPFRKLNYAYAIAELLWIWNGRKDVKFLLPYNKQIAKFSDDGKEFYGAYGPHWVGQDKYVIDKLIDDQNSRQAVITIWRQNPPTTKDVPCTIMFHFLVRDGKLKMITYMRSQDLWLGFPYDLFTFTHLQQFIASELGLPCGTYTHVVGSEHLYAEDLPGVEWALKYPGDAVELPLIGEGDLSELTTLEAELTNYGPSDGVGHDSIWVDLWLRFLNAYLAKKRGIPCGFPEPFHTIRSHSAKIRAGIGGSQITRTVRGDEGGFKKC